MPLSQCFIKGKDLSCVLDFDDDSLVPGTFNCEGICDCIPDDRAIILSVGQTPIIITGATKRRKAVINCAFLFGEYSIKH